MGRHGSILRWTHKGLSEDESQNERWRKGQKKEKERQRRQKETEWEVEREKTRVLAHRRTMTINISSFNNASLYAKKRTCVTLSLSFGRGRRKSSVSNKRTIEKGTFFWSFITDLCFGHWHMSPAASLTLFLRTRPVHNLRNLCTMRSKRYCATYNLLAQKS